MAHPNSFAAALAELDQARLRAAFEACRQSGGDRYDRTTLNRWLTGSIPTRGDFIQRLADELDDQALFEAWETARDNRSPSKAKAVVSRFDSLSDEDKDWVFHEVRASYLSTFPSVRSRMSYVIEVDDPAEPKDGHLTIRLVLSWAGAIPAQAEAVVVTEHDALGDAYANAACIFREMLDFDPKRLAEQLNAEPSPVLAVNPLDSNAPRGSHHVGKQIEPGRFRFDNPEASNAQVRLSLSYPYPRGQGVFFIRLGQYQVPDTFEVTLRLNSDTASAPRAFPFLPPGRQREFAQSYPRPNELFLTFGTGNTVYGEGDGLVLHWTES